MGTIAYVLAALLDCNAMKVCVFPLRIIVEDERARVCF
jgi:hypothetical protein